MEIENKLKQLGILLDGKSGHLYYANGFESLPLNFDLVFVRHGETYGNCGQATFDAKIDNKLVKSGIKNHRNRIFQGNVDSEINQLTALGNDQAIEAALKLEHQLLDNQWIPDLIFHSSLSRAKYTGIPFVERNGFKDRYIELKDIREMSFGSWDNRRICDLTEENPCHLFYRNQNALIKQNGINGNGIYQISENFCEVLLRAKEVLENLNRQHLGKKILMFSHSMFGAACCILLGKGLQIENGQYLAFDGAKKNGVSYTIPYATPFLFIKTD